MEKVGKKEFNGMDIYRRENLSLAEFTARTSLMATGVILAQATPPSISTIPLLLVLFSFRSSNLSSPFTPILGVILY